MSNAEIIRDKHDTADATAEARVNLIEEAFSPAAKSRATYTPIEAGKLAEVSSEQMHNHPEEKAQGVDHMDIVQWDHFGATKFGYDSQNQLIAVTHINGTTPTPIELKMDKAQAEAKIGKGANAGWYAYNPAVNKFDKKPHTNDHLFSKHDKTWIYKDLDQDGRAIEFNTEQGGVSGNFTDDGFYVKSDRNGNILSMRRINNAASNSGLAREMNSQIIPYYKKDASGNDLVDGYGRKILDQFDEVGADGKALSTWVKDKDGNFMSMHSDKGAISFKSIYDVQLSADTGLAYSDKPVDKSKKELIASQTKPPETETVQVVEHKIPPAPPIFNRNGQEIKDAVADNEAVDPPADVSELANVAATLDTASSVGTDELSLLAPPNAPEETTKTVSEKPLSDLPVDVFAPRFRRYEKADIPKEFNLSYEQTGVHIDSVEVIPFQDSNILVGRRGNEQVLLKMDASLYIKPDAAERTALGQAEGKPGWYLNDGYLKDTAKIRKTLHDDYGVCKDGTFLTRDNKNPEIGYICKTDGTVLEGTWSGDGAFIARDSKNPETGHVYKLNEEPIAVKFNALGAAIESNKENSIKTIRRSDHTLLTVQYTNPADPASLNKIAETSANGQSIVWTKIEGRKNDFEYKDAQGYSHIRRNVELANNGNLSYVHENDFYANHNNPLTTIVRSNGAELKTGVNMTKYKFDDQGRFLKVEPSTQGIQSGAKIYEYTYLNNYDEKISDLRMQNPYANPQVPDLTFRMLRIGNSNDWHYMVYRDVKDANNQLYRQHWNPRMRQWISQQIKKSNDKDGLDLRIWSNIRGAIAVDKHGNYSQQLSTIS